MADEVGIVDLVQSYVTDFITRHSYLSREGTTPEAILRARIDAARHPDLHAIIELYNEEAAENEPVLEGVVHRLVGMHTKPLEKRGKQHRISEHTEYWAICQNEGCNFRRAAVFYSKSRGDVKPEPENVVYPTEGSAKFRGANLICPSCGLEGVISIPTATILFVREYETAAQKREQVLDTISYVTENRAYSSQENNWSKNKKHLETMRIILTELAKYYPSFRQAVSDATKRGSVALDLDKVSEIDPLVLYPVLEKGTHHILDMEDIATIPAGWGRLLNNAIQQNINAPVAIIRQSLKTPASFLEKVLEARFSHRERPMDLYRFRVIVEKEEDVRGLKELILRTCVSHKGCFLADRGDEPNPEDTYLHPKKRPDGKEIPLHRVQFYLMESKGTAQIPVEIQLNTYRDERIAHIDPEIGEEAYRDWRDGYRLTLFKPPFDRLFVAISNPERCAKRDPAAYLTMLLDRLEEEAKKQPKQKAQKQKAILRTLTLEILLNHCTDVLDLPGLSPHQARDIQERLESIRSEHFVRLGLVEGWENIEELEDRTYLRDIYLPRAVGSVGEFVRVGLPGKIRGPLEEEQQYLLSLGLRVDEAHRIIDLFRVYTEEATVEATVVQEKGKARLAKKGDKGKKKKVRKYRELAN